MTFEQMLQFLIPFFFGAIIAGMMFWMYKRKKIGTFDALGKEILEKAQQETAILKKNAEIEMEQHRIALQTENEGIRQKERRQFHEEMERLKQREDKVDSRIQLNEKKAQEIEKKEAFITEKNRELEKLLQNASTLNEQSIQELEKISGITKTEAKNLLLNKLTLEVETDAAHLIRKTRKEAEAEADRVANSIIATAINRLAVPCVSEATVCTVTLPTEDMKARIIGKEGRNIRALERTTGVNFVIDDTPGAVVLTGFDPIRLHVAKTALTNLVKDGRIHPTRIEEAVDKAATAIQEEIYSAGEDAALRAGCVNIHPELIKLLGKLNFRYSYGQNILKHSLEVSHLLGIMAGELGLDVRLAKRIGILHDMGKAVTHEVEGSHALIGHNLALQYGETKEVANGIGCHHYEMDPLTIEGSLCSAADAISASRLGARCESIEEYIKRLKRLEEIAGEIPGVKKAFALQAGREIRVEVLPHIIEDNQTNDIARNLTKRIETELQFSGKIKVTVLRETRSVEYAV